MNLFLIVLFAEVIVGVSKNDVIFVNHTGLPIARIQIGERILEGSGANVTEKLFITVTPVKHRLRLVFRGGADVDWPRFDFREVHEIIFERTANKIEARTK